MGLELTKMSLQLSMLLNNSKHISMQNYKTKRFLLKKSFPINRAPGQNKPNEVSAFSLKNISCCHALLAWDASTILLRKSAFLLI